MLNLVYSPLMRYPTPRNSGLPFLGLNFIPFFLVAFLAFFSSQFPAAPKRLSRLCRRAFLFADADSERA